VAKEMAVNEMARRRHLAKSAYEYARRLAAGGVKWLAWPEMLSKLWRNRGG